MTPQTDAGKALYRGILSGALSLWTDDEGGQAEIAETIARVEVQAALAVARHFDEDAFACDFRGQTSINLPNTEGVVVLGPVATR